jgi:hypothetical protein
MVGGDLFLWAKETGPRGRYGIMHVDKKTREGRPKEV